MFDYVKFVTHNSKKDGKFDDTTLATWNTGVTVVIQCLGFIGESYSPIAGKR